MATCGVEVVEVVADARASFGHGGVATDVNVFVLHRAPQPFDENVVDPAAFAVHRDADVRGFEYVGEVPACELRSLVRVEYVRLAEVLQRLLERVDAKRIVEGVG